jgi:SAM-dependent methyltransferase
MFPTLSDIFQRPKPFEFNTVQTLWDDPHISRQMLQFHLDPVVDAASRNHASIQKSVEWMRSHFSIHSGTRICDLGCGPGLYTSALAAFSDHVTGVDFSRNSLAYARARSAETGQKIEYIQSNYLDFHPTGQFDLITMIMSDFCVLDPKQRVTLLQNISGMLAPGGCFVFDAYLPNAFQTFQETTACEFRFMDGFWAEGDYFGFVNRFKYPDDLVTLEKYTIIQPTRQWTVYNWLQYYTPAALHRLITANGMRIDEMFADVSGAEFDPGADEFALVIRKG